jgi:hypothetical protein
MFVRIGDECQARVREITSSLPPSGICAGGATEGAGGTRTPESTVQELFLEGFRQDAVDMAYKVLDVGQDPR